DTYEQERIAFAKTLVATTDRGFTPLVAEGIMGELARRVLAPLFFTIGTRFERTRHAFFRTLSQTHIHYSGSPLSEGEAGDVQGGDRLPWLGDSSDNFAPLRSLDWQVHVYGDAERELEETCARVRMPLHVFPWGDAAERAGFEEGASYLVRPDGYVAVAASRGTHEALGAFVERFKLRVLVWT